MVISTGGHYLVCVSGFAVGESVSDREGAFHPLLTAVLTPVGHNQHKV